jgi:hypothetical protein
MVSANDNAAPLPADPGFLTPPSRVVLRGAFRCIPCREGSGRLAPRDELRKLEEHGRAPHPAHNPAQPGRITARNPTSDEESGKNIFKFRLNLIGYYLLPWWTADCGRWNVQAHLMMMRRMCGMLLQSTLPIKEVPWRQLRLSKIYSIKQSNSCTKQDLTCNPDTLGEPTTYISSNQYKCPKFRAHTCVCMTSCANVELESLESELPRPRAS